MATKTIVDYRRRDQRNNTLENPFWLSSGIINFPDVEDKYGVLFSFPKSNQQIMVLQVAFHLLTAITAASTVTFGNATLATDDVTTDGVATTVDDDSYLLSADITLATPGWYGPTTANTSTWLTAAIATRTWAAPFLITGADATVPCIVVTAANAGTIIAGTGVFHMLVTTLPGSTY